MGSESDQGFPVVHSVEWVQYMMDGSHLHRLWHSADIFIGALKPMMDENEEGDT